MKAILDHAKWRDANLPADPFARHQQKLVCEAITRQLVCGLAGSNRWARLERVLENGDVLDHLEQAQELVGDSRVHKAAATEIARNLWRWAKHPTERGPGLAVAIRDLAVSAGFGGRTDLVPFLIRLASSPGRLAAWEAQDRAKLIDGLLITPALIRAARFAVLGTRALESDTPRGAGGGDR